MGNKKGGGDAPAQIRPSEEWQKILNISKRYAIPAERRFVRQEPLLNQMQDIAKTSAGQLPGFQDLLTNAYQTSQQDYPQAREWIQGAYGAMPQTQGLLDTLQSAYGTAVPTEQLTGMIMPGLATAQQVAASGGALTGDALRYATQQAAARNAAAGMATTNPGMFAEALNRQQYAEQRYNNALQQLIGGTQAVSGLDTANLQRALGYTQGMQGLGMTGLQAALLAGQGMTGMDAQQLSQALGYAQGMQGLNTTAMNQLLGAELGGIQAWQGVTNPVAQTVQSAMDFNANAQAAANINQANQKNNTTSGVLSLLGSVAAAY
jgi:hypothetical protein